MGTEITDLYCLENPPEPETDSRYALLPNLVCKVKYRKNHHKEITWISRRSHVGVSSLISRMPRNITICQVPGTNEYHLLSRRFKWTIS